MKIVVAIVQVDRKWGWMSQAGTKTQWVGGMGMKAGVATTAVDVDVLAAKTAADV